MDIIYNDITNIGNTYSGASIEINIESNNTNNKNDTDFTVTNSVTLYDFDKETEIFSLEIDYDGKIDTIDFSDDLLEIGSETNKLPLNKTFYKIIKFDSDKYYLDFN